MGLSSAREIASDTKRRFSPIMPVLRFYKLREIERDDLEYGVQLGQGGVTSDQESTPDERTDVAQDDA